MSTTTTVDTTPKPGNQSLLFRDLASPVSTHSRVVVVDRKFTTPSQVAAVSALWRENFSNSDLPPPPMLTLEDRSDFSPQSGIPDFGLEFSTPKRNATWYDAVGLSQQQKNWDQHSPVGSLSWWSGGGEQEEKGKSSPVEGVVQPGALIMLPPPREVARPEMKRSSLPVGSFDEQEEWVTVYGFSPGDTNLVLWEFEKCGVILKHVLGPRDANWMHILYQSRSDAQKALSKDGIQINGVLIVGVKPVDPELLHLLNERMSNQGFLTSPIAPMVKSSELNYLRASPQPYYLQKGSGSTYQLAGTIATPAKSAVSKIMDLMFGV